MARAVVGGFTVAIFLTLFVVPACIWYSVNSVKLTHRSSKQEKEERREAE
ncbi:MAG: hypothetical protein KAR40_15850 [Candidatus Sabulitectum sp.]|nr:hypothetical protein [Candidatus Sabulitectum sp.]